MSTLSTSRVNEGIGHKLSAIRTSVALTQSEFAKALGLSFRAYGNYERGEREIPVAVVRVLADRFDIDPLWLLTGDEPSPQRIASRVLKGALLRKVIEVVADAITRHRRALPPAKLAAAIQLGYEYCAETGSDNEVRIRDMINLAA